ncbi:hypothetical protein LTR51_007916 [Lithohypha guttulata]|nr:hypothetical protein LTR51_007916 [Lithohypha guttulata]
MWASKYASMQATSPPASVPIIAPREPMATRISATPNSATKVGAHSVSLNPFSLQAVPAKVTNSQELSASHKKDAETGATITTASNAAMKQFGFEQAVKITLKGQKSERAIDKSLYIRACPDLEAHVKIGDESQSFVVEKPGLLDKGLGAMADSIERKPGCYVQAQYDDYNKYTPQKMRRAARRNFMKLYESILAGGDLPETLSAMVENISQVMTPSDQLRQEILLVSRRYDAIVQKLPVLANILAADKSLDAPKPVLEVSLLDMAISESRSSHEGITPLSHATEAIQPAPRVVKDVNIPTDQRPDQATEITKSSLANDEKFREVLEESRRECTKLKIAKGAIEEENMKLKTVVENGRAINAELKKELDTAKAYVTELEKENKVQRATISQQIVLRHDKQKYEFGASKASATREEKEGELKQAKVKIGDLEKDYELARDEIKHHLEEKKIIKKELEALKTQSSLPAKTMPLSPKAESGNVQLLKSQLSGINDSAHQRKAILLQQQLEDLKTKYEKGVEIATEEADNLKNAVYDLKVDLKASETAQKDSEDKYLAQVDALQRAEDAQKTQAERISYLEKRVESEQDARKTQSQRATQLEKRLQRNDELLQAHDDLRKATELSADKARDTVDMLRGAAQAAKVELDAQKQECQKLRQKVDAAQKKVSKVYRD